MKLFFLFLFFPFFTFSQKVKVNEYDKFLKQQRVEVEPVQLINTGKNKVDLSYSFTTSTPYLQLSGSGWGATTIDIDDRAIFLFSNDSTITVTSPRLQSFIPGIQQSSFKHEYSVKIEDLENLSRYDLVSIRKYSFTDFDDISVPSASAAKIKKLSALFLDELKKANVIKRLKHIDLQNIANYIGDSVRFCSKVYATRFYETSENKPTILDIQPTFSEPFVNAVILEQDRKNFVVAPEVMYANKEVCLCGVVQTAKKSIQITLRNKNQIQVKSPINLEETAYFIGDSVTVTGKVASIKSFSENDNLPLLLNLGASYPNQLLTVAIENKSRQLFNEAPENMFKNKEIRVSGKVEVYKNKPQIIIRHKDQIQLLKNDAFLTVSNKAETADNNQNAMVKTVVQKETQTPSPAAETLAEFPGGQSELIKYLSVNLECPVGARFDEPKSVTLSFMVAADGKINNIQVRESAGKMFDIEAIRVMNQMPKWKPNTKNGMPVSSGTIVQKITFNCGE